MPIQRTQRRAPRGLHTLLRIVVCAACLLPLVGCAGMHPSNDRTWSPDQAVLPYAKFLGDEVLVHNIRNCDYRTPDDYDVHWEDRTYRVSDVQQIDFIVCPFPEMPELAHTMLSFGFRNGEHLALSVEIRKELGEKYSPSGGFRNEFELMYVLGDERDLIGLRANYRLEEVLLYPGRATPEQAQAMFADVLRRANELAEKPEFYNTLYNNCTTNLVAHVNHVSPGRIPSDDYRVLLTGHSDELAYKLGLLDVAEPYDVARQHARINELAYLYRDAPDFSARIRMPGAPPVLEEAQTVAAREQSP